MTRAGVFCIGCTEDFVASVQDAYSELKNQRDIDLHVVHVSQASEVRQSEFRSWEPYRIALFVGEPGLPDMKAVLEEIRAEGIPHKLCIFSTCTTKRISWITDRLEETVDPTRIRKFFAYCCKKKDRPRAIANALVREIAQKRI